MVLRYSTLSLCGGKGDRTATRHGTEIQHSGTLMKTHPSEKGGGLEVMAMQTPSPGTSSAGNRLPELPNSWRAGDKMTSSV